MVVTQVLLNTLHKGKPEAGLLEGMKWILLDRKQARVFQGCGSMTHSLFIFKIGLKGQKTFHTGLSNQ